MRKLTDPAVRGTLIILIAAGFAVVSLGLVIAQEEPRGSVTGAVLGADGEPLKGARIYIARKDEPPVSGVTRADGTFTLTDVPTGTYSGYVVARGHQWYDLLSEGFDPIVVKEGKTTELGFMRLEPQPPSLFYVVVPDYAPGEPVRFPLRGYSRFTVASVDVDVYRFDYASHIRGKTDTESDTLPRPQSLGSPVHRAHYDIRTDEQGYFERQITLPVKDPGGYLIHARLETTETVYSILITDLALVVKRAPEKTLVFASSFTERRPVSGARIEIYGRDGLVAKGTTGPDGIMIENSALRDSTRILGTLGDHCAVSSTYSGSYDQSYKCLIFTDRPVYRPGHKVQFKGILRKSPPGRYLPVTGVQVPVTVTDPDGNGVAQLTLPTDRFGSFHGAVDIDEGAEPGYYEVTARYEGETFYGSFKVEEYRKPEFKAEVSFSKRHYVGGQTIRATVNAEYYFGAPVANARVEYRVYRSPDYFYYSPDEESDISFFDELLESEYGSGYYYGYGELLAEGETVADESGRASIEVPTARTRSEQRYEIEVTVSDPSGRGVDASAGVLVTPALFTFSLDTDRYFYRPGEKVTATVYAVDYDGRRQPDVEAKLTLIPERRPHEKRPKPVFTKKLRLGADGAGKITFTVPKEGSYVLQAEAPDRSGRTARGEIWIWSADDSWTGAGYTSASLEVVLDRKIYSVGDTARVMINSPAPDSWVLFTVEGRRLFEHRIIHLESTGAVLEIPVTADLAPNAFINACMIAGKELITASRPLLISPTGNFLTVKIEPDRSKYEPGERLSYQITTLDSSGKGVPAQVALGVVDESVYAIREDTTADIRRFFYGPEWNKVSTSFSFSDFYYGGVDKFEGRVRRYFPDTAYWNPVIVTDERGKAVVSFNLPDNLTTWRATARAVTTNTQVGSAVDRVVVTRNLLVRLQVPRVLRQRDTITLSAVVHNYTSREQEVRVRLDADGIRLLGPAVQTLKVRPKTAGRVEWTAAVDRPGTARIAVYAQGQTDQDAVELTAPVLPHGVPEYDFAAGRAAGQTSFSLKTAPQIIPEASVLEMGFAPGIAGAALGLVEALGRYPTDTVEGIMDVLLPNVVVYQALKQAGIDSPELQDRITRMVKRDLRTVYRWQLLEGGWGWGEFGEKDPWITAYVVYGLTRAAQAGLPVDRKVLENGIESAKISLPHAGDLGKRSTIIYALTVAGHGRIDWINQVLFDSRLQNYSLALMILALDEMGQKARAKSLVPKLEAGAVESGLHCYWPETFPWGFYSCNDYETTAYAIRALLAVDPDNPRIPKAVRWLIDRRKGDRYEGNYDTASVVYALADYLRVHRPVAPDLEARVYVNGRLADTFRLDAASLYAPERKLVISGGALKPGSNTVRIERTGSGELFYWARLKYHSSAEDVKATRGKVSIERRYYLLKPVRHPKEGIVYRPVPLRGPARVGQLIRCRLVIQAPKDFQYLVVTDPLPSGCEVARRPVNVMADWHEWDFWWSGESARDDRVEFFLAQVYEGRRVIEYDFRPEMKGSFHVMPASAQGRFEPDIYAHSAEGRFEVR